MELLLSTDSYGYPIFERGSEPHIFFHGPSI